MPLKAKWGVEGDFDSEDFDSEDFSLEVNVEKGLKINQSFDVENGLKGKLACNWKCGLKVKV